jgi:hypothetical protein
METLMKTLQFENRFDPKDTPRSLFSTPVRDRVFAILLVLAIAAVTIASTTGDTDSSHGGNLILAPGHPDLEPALY